MNDLSIVASVMFVLYWLSFMYCMCLHYKIMELEKLVLNNTKATIGNATAGLKIIEGSVKRFNELEDIIKEGNNNGNS